MEKENNIGNVQVTIKSKKTGEILFNQECAAFYGCYAFNVTDDGFQSGNIMFADCNIQVAVQLADNLEKKTFPEAKMTIIQKIFSDPKLSKMLLDDVKNIKDTDDDLQ